MEGILSRMIWVLAVSVVVAYLVYLIVGNIVNAQAYGANHPVVIRDDLEANRHLLSGMLMVPTPCDQLSVTATKIGSVSYRLNFTTWHEPSVTCSAESTPRAFRLVLFAPAAGIDFVATLDGVGFPIAVIPLSAASDTTDSAVE